MTRLLPRIGVLSQSAFRLALCVCLLCCNLPVVDAAKKKTAEPAPQPVVQQHPAFDYYYYAAITAINNEEFERAFALLRYCVGVEPENAAVNALLGILYEAIASDGLATTYYSQAVASDPDNWLYRRNLVELLAQDQTPQAIALVQAELDAHPDNEDALSALSALYKADFDFKQAIAALDKLEKVVGITYDISVEKYYLYMALGKSGKAVKELDKLVSEYPDVPDYQVLMGEILLYQNRPAQALEQFQKVLAEYPDNPSVYLSLSNYYQAQDQPDKAMETIMAALENRQLDVDTKLVMLSQYADRLARSQKYTAAMDTLLSTMLDLYPLEEDVYGFYAKYLLYNDRMDEAVPVLHTMLDINPKNAETWQMLISIGFENEDTVFLADVLEQAIGELPASPSWYLLLSIVYNQQGRTDDALQVCLSGLPYVSDDVDLAAEYYIQTGDLSYRLHQKAEAFAYYDKALALSPRNALLLNNYAYYLALEGMELNRAERMSAQTVEAEPRNAVYLDTYAWILFRQGNVSLAKIYIERAIDCLQDGQENDPEIWEHYGFILQASGNEQKSLEIFRKALELGSENEEVKQILQSAE